MKKLTPKESKFIDLYFEIGHQNKAYELSYECSNMKQATIDNNGYMLAKKENVAFEITARRAILAERCNVTQEKILLGYFKLIDDYNEGIRLARSTDKKENAASYRMANYINSSSVVSALKAIAEMTGLTAPKIDAINNGIIVNYINPK